METFDSIPLKASDLKAAYDGERDLKKIAIKKDYLRLSGDALFYTIQGEGPTIGLPALFVRLHHCNLKCTWCDAYYTWDKTSKEFWTESREIGIEECAELIDTAWPSKDGDRRVVWTGGEPLMHKDQIDKVMTSIWNNNWGAPFWYPEIETNGTIMPTKLQLENYQFNVSPKLTNSRNANVKSIKPKVLKALNSVNSTFKFVCRDEYDIQELLTNYGHHIDQHKIIIMPEGVTEEEITPHARVLAVPCKKYGLRLLPRLQAIAFEGAARGV